MEAAGVLSVAFGLGLLLHASQTAFFTAISGHIKTLLLHRRRLVLLSFLLCVSVFSITQFATLLLLEDASCEVAVRFTLFFDQAARVAALALVVWKVCDEAGARNEAVVWVLVVALRMLMGGIMVGFTGMTFIPVCFPQPTHVVVGIVHTAFDGVVWAALGWRIISIWMLFVDQGRGGANGGGKSQGYGLFLIVLGFVGWTIGSFPYMMSVGGSIFIRMIPYILTLALALGVLSCFPSIVFSVPVKADDYKLRRFGSSVPSPVRRGRSMSSPNFNSDMEANKFTSYGANSYTGARTSQMFRSIIGAPIVHPGTAIPWSLDTDAADITRPKPTKAAETRRPSVPPSHGAKGSILGPRISGPIGPILRNGSSDAGEITVEGASPINPFSRVKTVDLKTAAEAERQRIDAVFEREQQRKSVTPPTAKGFPITTPNGSIGRSTSVKRKPLVPQLPSGPAAYRVSAVSGLRGTQQETASDSPSSLRQSAYAVAEGSDWGMRYSTRANSVSTEDDGYTVVSHAPYNLAAPPRIPQLEGIRGDTKVMFVNEIVYDYPALVNSIVGNSIVGKTDVALSTSRYSHSTATTMRRSPSSATKQLPGILTPTREVDELFTGSSSSTPVMERPRNVKKELERGIFPPNRDFTLAAEMKYKKKNLTVAMERSDLPLSVPLKPLFSPPAQKVVVKKPSREIVFPIPPVRENSVRKPAPPPILITIPAIFSPEIVQQAPTSDADNTPEQISSAKPAVPEKSDKRMTVGINRHPAVDEEANGNATYKATKVWTDGLSVTEESTRSSYSIIEPLPPIAYEPGSDTSPMSSVSLSGFTASTILRRSLISLTTSPKIKEEDEGEFTDIDVDSCSEISEDEVEEYGSDEQTQSEADEMIMSGGEGYSSEEESFEEDYFTDSDEGRGYLGDDVVISDVEDGTTYDKIALAERKLNAKMHALTAGSLPDTIPHQFQIGDRIPTFSESRRKYGSRRKPPPSPIGFLMCQRRESQQRIQARLTMLAGSRNLAPMEDLMNRLPASSKRGTRVSYISDGRNSLLARLEMEMDQQESQWMGMHQDLKRSSVESSEDYSVQRPALLSQSLAQRRSLLARLNSGIDRRLSAQTTMTSNTSVSPAPVPDAWQHQLVEAQMEYLAQAPSFPGNVGEISLKPMAILASQHTPASVISESEFDHSEIESPLSVQGSARRKSFYQNDNSSFVIGEADDDDDGEVEYEEEEEEEEEEGEEEEEEEGEEEEEEEGEEEEYCDEGEVIQLLQATVYSPSIRSASIQSETPAQTCYSSTTEAFSPKTKPPASLLWKPQVPQEITSKANLLWSYRTLTPESAFVFPPAVGLRSKKRISNTLLVKSATHLWAKPHPARPASVTGLWCSSKDVRTKSIIVSPTSGRTRRSLKRVTFVEEVVTVESTGLFGKLKKLWGASKKNIQPATEVPAIPVISQSLEVQPKVQEKPIRQIMDAIAVMYANRMLPPLSVQESKESTKHAQNITRSALWSKTENRTLTTSNMKLWDPTQTPAPKPLQTAFTEDVSEIRTKSRAATLPILESSNLWGVAEVEVSATLWTNPRSGYLWPQGPAAAAPAEHLWPSASLPAIEPSSPRFNSPRLSRASTLALAPLESTELWEAVPKQELQDSTGLWSRRSAGGRDLCSFGSAHIRTFDYLWPTAVSLPTSHLIVNVPLSIRSRPRTALEVLESHGLWQLASSTVATRRLWAAPVKKSALWPQGEITKAVGSLWPSAASLPFEFQVRSRSHRAPSTLALATLESMELWKAANFGLEEESTGLWSVRPDVPRNQELYFREPEQMCGFDYLWPTAPLPASYLAVILPAVRSRPSTSTLATLDLTSRELWQPASDVTAPRLWSVPVKKSALWPQGEVSVSIPGSLWPSAASLPLETQVGDCSRRGPSTLALAQLESAELWKPVAIELEAGSAGLWPGKFNSPRSQDLCFQELTQIHRPDYLWPTAASLPASYLAVDTPPIRSRPSTITPATLTSRELWQASATAPSLWTAPTRKCALWPQGEISRSVLGSLWPSAASLPFEIQARQRLHGTPPPTLALEPLQSTELWNAAIIAPGLWTAVEKSALWPRGQLSGPTGYLWPSAPALCLAIGAPGGVRVQSRTIAPAAITSTALWTPRGDVKTLRSSEFGGLWSRRDVKVEVEVEGAEKGEEENVDVDVEVESGEIVVESVMEEEDKEQEEDEYKVKEKESKTKLWTKPQNTPIAPSGHLWPSAHQPSVSNPRTSPLPTPTRPRPRPRPRPTLLLQQVKSTSLWPSKPIQATLWSLPTQQPGLWPSGGSAKTDLWPSARPLPILTLPLASHRSHIPTVLDSHIWEQSTKGLWATAIAPRSGRQGTYDLRTETVTLVPGLWAARPQTIKNGLWLEGKVDGIAMGLWPLARSLPSLPVERDVRVRHVLGDLAVLESRELWTPDSKPALWTKPKSAGSGLWPGGKEEVASRGSLWCAPDNTEIVRRSNIMLKIAVGEERAVRKKDIVGTIEVVSGELWSLEELRLESSGWLLRQKRKAYTSSPLDITKLGSAATLAATPDIAPAAFGLWVKSSPVPDTRPAALWQPKAAATIEACSRLNIYSISPRRKTVQPAISSLRRAHGTLWSSPLPDASRQHTWMPALQDGLWNANSMIASLAQINAQKSLLWSKHGRARTSAFAHWPVPSHSAGHTRLSVPLEAATGSLWLSAGDQDAVVRRGSSHPGPRCLPFVPPRPAQVLLWHRHDKPPVVPVPIPAAPSRSQPVNKRASIITAVLPPLFLAPPQAPARIGPAKKSPSHPRGLWRAPISGTKNPHRSSNTTPVLAPSAESQLWSKSHSGNSLFSDITQSLRSVRNPGTPITISMEGPLWKYPNDSVPSLWRKKDKPSALWSVNGTATSVPVPVPVATTHLWCENPSATAPIFIGLSLESSRSRREFTLKTFSAPPEGLWEKASEPVVELNTGLWGTTETLIPNKALLLWQKDSTATPMFADLPVEPYRSKKDHSTITLPVFSEGMWKKRTALPEKPQLWKPTPKLTYLWDSSSRTKTLAQILLEKKAKEIKKPLWTKGQASRTTTKTPHRSPLVAVRISNDTTLPKASGGLWKPKTATKQPPKLWTLKAVTKASKPASTPLWAKEHAARTTEAVPERTKVAFIPSNTPLPVVSGTLWKPRSPEIKISLWQRPIKTVATYRRTSVSAPLWAKETASRTTTARPERHTFVPKKKASTTLNKASGSLWQPKATPPDGLWEVVPRPRRASLLWVKHAASEVAPVRTSVPKHIIDPPLPVVSGTLWHQEPVPDAKSLWKPPVKAVPHYTVSALWSKEHASRTTTARPSRAPFTPKPVSKSHTLPAATGNLWKPVPATVPLTLWTRKSAASGVWDAEGRTPTLAEINHRLATRQDSLWQRRSVLTSKAVSADADPAAKLFTPKKKFDTSTAPAFGSLWQPISPVIQNSVMWITRSSRSSSVDGEFVSPNLSRASTLSDMSDGEVSPMTVEDRFEPQIARVHSTKASISSSVGESLWRPVEEYGKKKELALWSSEVREERRSIFFSERLVKIPLPGIDQERELPMFDASHSLWKPSVEETKTIWTTRETICDSGSESETDFHDAESHDESSFHDADSDFHDAASQLSDDSQYEDFEHVFPQSAFEPDHSPAEQSHVVVGQFRRDNYLPHSSQNEHTLPENSPFASNLRIRSLRRKLRPTIIPSEDRKRREAEESPKDNPSDVESGAPKESGGEMEPVAPGAGWLWNKGIV